MGQVLLFIGINYNKQKLISSKFEDFHICPFMPISFIHIGRNPSNRSTRVMEANRLNLQINIKFKDKYLPEDLVS